MFHEMYFSEYKETSLDQRLENFVQQKCSLYNDIGENNINVE